MSATKRRPKAAVRAGIDSDTLIAAIRDRGVMSHDLRYCAHEAHHALACRVRRPWTVDAINEAMQRTFRPYCERLADEFRARAVEQIVCQRAGVKIEDIEKWAFVTIRECLTIDRVQICAASDFDKVVAAITRQMTDPETVAAADAVVALAVKGAT